MYMLDLKVGKSYTSTKVRNVQTIKPNIVIFATSNSTERLRKVNIIKKYNMILIKWVMKTRGQSTKSSFNSFDFDPAAMTSKKRQTISG